MDSKEIEKKKNIEITKKYAFLAAGFFFLFFAFGVLFNIFQPEETAYFFDLIAEEFSFLESLNFYYVLLFIFINNTIKVFIAMLLGFLFAIVPLLFLAINGFVLGVVVAYVFPQFGFVGLFLSLFLHGVFELVALFIGSGVGIYMGVKSIQLLRSGELSFKDLRNILKLKKENRAIVELKKIFNFSIDVFVYVVLPLLLLAAIIESIVIFLI